MAKHRCISVPEAIQRIANAPDRRLAWELFVFFSRFEYALKRDRRYLMPGSGDAQPNWDCFASNANANFKPDSSDELRSAVDFFLEAPPRKQLRVDGAMTWSEPQAWDHRDPLLLWLLRAVRIVRNNLFHGGKFPLLLVSEPSRDRDLILSGLQILRGALAIDSEVQAQFLDGLE